MTAARNAQWSVGAAGPVLRLVAGGDPHEVVWQDFALCTEADPDAWLPPDGASVWSAMMTCRRCPVRSQCLEFAQASPFPVWGVWGGVIFADGVITATEIRCKRDLHELDEENTYVGIDDSHNCRACKRERRREAAA